jgi:hypothetical protein
MTPRALGTALGIWALACAVACGLVHRAFALQEDPAHPRVVVASLWETGVLVGRASLAHPGDRAPELDALLSAHPAATLVYESVVAEGPVLARPEAALALSFVSGRDGVAATLAGRTEYVTPDDLLARQAYDRQVLSSSFGITAGLDVPVLFAILSERFGRSARDLAETLELRRIRVVRDARGETPARTVTAETLTDDDARDAAIAAARFLVRGIDDNGRFRYLVDAPTNRTLPGYDWPRHAGATYFLAQVVRVAPDPAIREGALRAAAYMRDNARVACGDARCIGSTPIVDLGSTALAIVAFVEIAKTLDPEYRRLIPELTAFVRGQQRPNGDLMHEYNREVSRPIDVQLVYYTGEAALALSRAYNLLGDPRDRDVAARALAYLVGPGWSFVGSRYYFGEEHWTCQAMDDMWQSAPNRAALDFCLRWRAFDANLQFNPGDTPYDAEGAYGFSALAAPRLTPAGSRTEAALATLEVAEKAGVAAPWLEVQARKALAMLIRHQFRPGPRHLFVDPAAVEGAFPASESDWQLRIDFAQHAGSALLRWLDRSKP